MTDAEQKTASLAKKIVAMMQAANEKAVAKDRNDQQHYDFVSAETVIDRFTPSCIALGIATTTKYDTTSPWDATKPVGAKVWNYAQVTCTITLVDADTGERWTTNGLGAGLDGADKHIAKAQTQARREAIKALLQLRTGERLDPEADEETDRSQSERREPARVPHPEHAPPTPSGAWVLTWGPKKGTAIDALTNDAEGAATIESYRKRAAELLADEKTPESQRKTLDWTLRCIAAARKAER